MQKSQIREIFEPFGEIKELHMMKDRDGSLRGFAFLKFHLKEPALLAIRKLNGQTYLPNCDKPIEVRFADNRTGLEQTYSAPSTKPLNEPSSPVYPKQPVIFLIFIPRLKSIPCIIPRMTLLIIIIG
jgi:RNA recognition motif-containing protein